MDRLGLSADELCRALAIDPLSVIAGELDDKPQLPILLALTEEAAEQAGEAVLRRWLRASGPGGRAGGHPLPGGDAGLRGGPPGPGASGPDGRPVDHLLAGEYAAFEDDLAGLAERGFVLRGGPR